MMEMRSSNRRTYVRYQMLIWDISQALKREEIDDYFVEDMKELKKIEGNWLSKRYFTNEFYKKVKVMLRRDRDK